MAFSESEILGQFDLANYGRPTKYFPIGRPHDIKYNFFLDLEHGYFETAGSSIHLYADSTRWAVVFEKCGYQNRGASAAIELTYFGNCIDYSVDEYPERNYITNVHRVPLIDPAEFERIENKDGDEMETFELIGQNIREIKIRDRMLSFNSDYQSYEKLGIMVRSYANPKKLIGFGDLIRYIHETNPEAVSATEEEIRNNIPVDIPKLLKIDEFHFVSAYNSANLPSQQETYQLIAKVLVALDTTKWQPTQQPNNSWKNWESGHL